MNTIVSINNNKINTLNAAIPSTSSLHAGTHVTPVYLNLYDLGGCTNACIHSLGLSYYHCAVQTHSAEYGFMGHPYKFTGLYKTSKHDSRFHLYRLRDSIEVGWTWFSEKEIDRIVNDLKPFYLGFNYHTVKKNSIQFAKYLLEQLSNDPELKHLEPIKILQFPSYLDRGRRLSDNLEFLQMFDTEKDIAEINILYFLYMKYEGNIKQISRILQCDTFDKLKRCIELIEQGIRQKKLPIFPALTTFDMKRAYDYLYIINVNNNPDGVSSNEQLTLTDIFHQFDTITLRGRTSIDRYLNIQRAKELAHVEQQSIPMTNAGLDRRSIPVNVQQHLDASRIVEIPQVSRRVGEGNISEEDDQIIQNLSTQKYHISIRKHDGEYTNLSHIPRSSLPQSQNQGRTPLISPSSSSISGLAIEQEPYPSTHPPTIIQTTPVLIDPLLKFEQLHMRTAVPVGTVLRLQETPNSNLPLTKLHLTTNTGYDSLSLTTNRSWKNPSLSRKRKLPRDLELTNDLYTITNENSLHHNYTNNAITTVPSSSQCPQSTVNIISFEKVKPNEEIDSSV